MARNTNIKLRRSATAGAIPTTSNLDLGELALNTNDGKLYMKTTEGSLDSVIQVGSATDTYFKIRKTINQDFTVTVASKTTDHVYHGSGSSSGYIINGIESPHLNLVPGNSYQFDQSDGSNSGHPLRFYYDAAKTTAYTAGVTTNGTAGSSGAYTKIVPTKDTPMVLYYQCSAHGYMGGSVSFATRNLTGFDTDELGEGSSNLYYTNARARGAISVTDVSGDGSLAYNNSTGVITYTGPSAAEVRAHLSAGTGMTFSGGAFATTITQYTNALARAAISVTDSGGDGSLAYNNSTGVITYTGPSAAEVRAHLSAGTGITYSGGQISIGQAVATTSNVQFNNVQVDGTLTSDDITSTNIAATGNLTVSGNLTVQGTTTTVNSTTLDVVDKNLTLNYHASNDTSGNANGAGITIQDAVNSSTDATLLWVAATDKFAFSHGITTPTVVASGTNILSGLTYPTSDGSSGQALVTDGSGNLSFSSISAGGNAFGTIAVSGQSNIAADSNSDTLTIVAGSNITLSSNAGTDTLTIAASGGEVTVQDEGSALSTAATTLNFVGSGVTASGTGATKTITIAGTGTVSEAFKTIAVSGQSNIVADSATDTLTLAAGSNMTITQDAGTDTITFASSGGSGSGQSALYKEYVYTPGSNTSTFSGSDANGSTLSYTVGYLSVYLNGVLLKPTTDYTASNGTSVVLVNTAVSGDVIQIATFVQIVGTGDSSLSELSGNGSTTAFTIAANPNHENNTQVYIDGIYQEKATYSISGTTLTFSAAPPSGSSIEVVIGSRNVTVDDVQGLTVNGTLDVTGATTLGGNLIHAGNLTLDAAGDIILDADGADVILKDAGTEFGRFSRVTSDFVIKSATSDKDIVFKGNDGGSTITALTLDMSDAGTAIFNHDVKLGSTHKVLANTINDSSNGYNLIKRISTYTQVGDNSNGLVVKDSGGAGTVGIGTNSPAVSLDIGSKTDAIRVPNGTTGQRPTAALGQLRYNTTTSEFEGYAAGAWGKIGGGGDSFGTIAVSGQSNVVAEQENDTLTFEAGAGIVITTDASNDKVTISGGSGSVFTTDLFTASGSGSALLAYTLSVTPSSENELICFIEGVYQNKNSYTLSGTTLTFDSGIVSGQEIVVHHVGAGIVGVSPTIDTFTGNGSTAAYTLSVAPPNENYLAVFWDGVYQHHSEYSVSGTTLTFTTNVPSSTAVEVYIPSVNGIGTPSDATVTPAKLSTGGPSWDTNSNQIIGSHYVRSDSTSMSTTSATTVATHAIATFRSVNYKVQITQGTNYHTSEINVIHDGSTVDITEYGTIFTGSSLGSLAAAISSGNLLLQFTPGSNASCTVKVMSTATTV